ncbi:hypothetical protein JQ596_23635 [Bradyrhizobium manausense]|uniref:hypothetical protein n=1 Tax=Bradyrhizobium manausense TaxID=989370 RepID=UPI001BAB9712|nr:hypothetical protein [Bradyrhizobium manausense]MBR0828533.1 hypothetical protein [Bradyrhizobium manausense]
MGGAEATGFIELARVDKSPIYVPEYSRFAETIAGAISIIAAADEGSRFSALIRVLRERLSVVELDGVLRGGYRSPSGKDTDRL